MKQKLYEKIAYLLPKGIVYWCYIRMHTHATYQFPLKSPEEVSCFDAMEVWYKE